MAAATVTSMLLNSGLWTARVTQSADVCSIDVLFHLPAHVLCIQFQLAGLFELIH